jgi:hypothetical protein
VKYTIDYIEDVPEEFGAYCKYPLLPRWGTCRITIRPKYKGDNGLLEHELEHVRQYNRNLFHALMYKYSASYRYQCELDAYRLQVRIYNYTDINQAGWIISALCNKYGFMIRYSRAKRDVENLIMGG